LYEGVHLASEEEEAGDAEEEVKDEGKELVDLGCYEVVTS